MLKLLLFVTFIESLATVMVERGVYFYTHEHLGFTDTANLALALALGVAYVIGALASHRISIRTGEKRLLLLTVTGQLLCHMAPVLAPSAVTVFAVGTGIGLFNGLKWPVIESYVSAGRTGRESARVIGLFNVAWSTSVPMALWITGPLLASYLSGPWLPPGAWLFITAGAINLATLSLLARVNARPTHLPDGHPHRPSTQQLEGLGALLTSSRWSMLACFALLFVVAPLMPTILTTRLGLTVAWAAPFSGFIDVVRVITFIVLWRTSAWHDRSGPLALVALATPIGFFLMVFGTNLALILAGQIVFGTTMGLAYYSALYYAMVVKNASVDAGGIHEGLIGLGFFLGPLVGLVGSSLAGPLNSGMLGMVTGVGPLILICVAGALWPLHQAKRLRARSS